MRFPYGTADFRAIRREGYYYADRTDRIRALEQTGKQLLFLRPRRFGKTAWLTTLENYYDLARAGEFDHLLEFTYLSRKDLGQTGEQLRALPREALVRLPGVAASLDDAEAQLAGHRHGLEPGLRRAPAPAHPRRRRPGLRAPELAQHAARRFALSKAKGHDHGGT